MRLEDLYLNNAFTLRDIYPAAAGISTGNVVSNAGNGKATANGKVEAAAKEMPLPTSPLVGGLVFLALLFGIMFAAQRFGSDSDFANLRLSAYNVLIISLAAAAGLPLIKFIAFKSGIPALRDWILAA